MDGISARPCARVWGTCNGRTAAAFSMVDMTVSTDDLAGLIARAKTHDAEAFDALVDAYSSRLFGLLYRLTGRREDAEDLVQEVFVRLVRCISSYEHDGRFTAWLFRIATNLARDRIRRCGRRPSMLSLDPADGDESAEWAELGDLSQPPPDQPLDLADDVDRLQRALAKLPAAEREVILLRHYSSMSFVAIANAMGTPLGTALARSHRGLGKLRKMMEQAK